MMCYQNEWVRCDVNSELMSKNWIAVASAEHVRLGRSQGFMQVNHGKAAPLRRIRPGDRVVYYSPSVQFKGKDKFQSFSAIGVVKPGDPYLAQMSESFSAYRRDVRWSGSDDAAIGPLLDLLEFTAGKKSWGYQLRFGLFEISEHGLVTCVQQRDQDHRLVRPFALEANAKHRAHHFEQTAWILGPQHAHQFFHARNLFVRIRT